jgi:XisI protein
VRSEELIVKFLTSLLFPSFWQNRHRVFGPVMHFDIKNGKIWIQWNGTEEDVGEQLVAMGVAKQDIVVGFHPPYIRQYTDYAVG